MKITTVTPKEVKPNVVIELTPEEANLIMRFCFYSRLNANNAGATVSQRAAATLYINLDDMGYVDHSK